MLLLMVMGPEALNHLAYLPLGVEGLVAKISSRSNSSSDVCLDGDDAVSPPAELCSVKESSSACAGEGVARAGDGGGVPSLERRRGDPSVELGVTDRARRAAAA